jgi:hypothetical protein
MQKLEIGWVTREAEVLVVEEVELEERQCDPWKLVDTLILETNSLIFDVAIDTYETRLISVVVGQE